MRSISSLDDTMVDFTTGLLAPSEVIHRVREFANAEYNVARIMIQEESALWEMPLAALTEPFQLLKRPNAKVLRNVLHPIECAYLVATSSNGFLQPSAVTSENGSRLDPIFRRSSSRAIPQASLQPGERHIIDKAAHFAGLKSGTTDRNIVRYGPGDIFRAHFDPIKASVGNPKGVRRIETNIIYLNSAYGGGETAFVRAGHAFRGGTGDMLQFANELDGGELDPSSLHAGLPVSYGTKWILVQWRSS